MKKQTAKCRGTSHGRRVRIRYHAPGTAPGTLDSVAGGEALAETPGRVRVMYYDREGVKEQDGAALENCKAPAVEDTGVLWLHIQGRATSTQLKTLAENFNIHPLALEDVLHRERHAKLETFEAQTFVVLNHLRHDEAHGLVTDQTSFFLGKNYVVSIDEGGEDMFEPIRHRIRSKAAFRGHGADYLLYALMDSIIDSAFPLLEALGEEIEALENEVLDSPTRETRNGIHYAKRKLMEMRRAWWPQRNVIAQLMREDNELLSDTARLYMHDCHDHCVIVMDFVETNREVMSSLLDTYLSSMTQRLNDVMKALTIIATIALPLAVIASIYGMNFEGGPWNMPELHWRYGYFYALGVMAAIAIGMIAWFRHKRWF